MSNAATAGRDAVIAGLIAGGCSEAEANRLWPLWLTISSLLRMGYTPRQIREVAEILSPEAADL